MPDALPAATLPIYPDLKSIRKHWNVPPITGLKFCYSNISIFQMNIALFYDSDYDIAIALVGIAIEQYLTV